MRTLIYSLTILLTFVSCTNNKPIAHATLQTDTAKWQSPQKQVTTQQSHVRNEITDTMLAQIINYYIKEYDSGSVRMDIDRSDTMVELSFTDTVSDPDMSQEIISISLAKHIDPILKGDINGDGITDMLISVREVYALNTAWSDYFLFLGKQNNESVLTDIQSDPDILGGSGYFYPKEMSNNMISGIENAYDENDARCCPSLYYSVHLRYKDGKLVKADEKAIPKPADFEE